MQWWEYQAPRLLTCRAVWQVFVRPAVLGSAVLPVVVAHALIQADLRARAAVAKRAGAAANGGVAVVEMLRTLETFPPRRPILPAVAILAASQRPSRPQSDQQEQKQKPPSRRRQQLPTPAPPHGTARQAGGRAGCRGSSCPQFGGSVNYATLPVPLSLSFLAAWIDTGSGHRSSSVRARESKKREENFERQKPA